jgi:hypothetical protein
MRGAVGVKPMIISEKVLQKLRALCMRSREPIQATAKFQRISLRGC